MTELVSLVVPFYNEAEAIPHFRAMLLPVLEAIPGTDWEIICVDDGSADTTLLQLVALAQADPRFRVIEFSRNFGKEAALTAGIDAARGAAVIPIDADLQDPPELIAQMLAAWRAGAEVVLARRTDRTSDGVLKRKTAAWFYRLHNRMSHTKIPENVGDFRLMDRVVVNALKQLPERQRFMKGLFAWIGYPQAQVLYDRAPRAAGTTKWNYGRLWRFAVEGVTSFSTVPLRLATWVGTLTSLLAFAYGGWIVLKVFVWGISVPGYASLIVAILFLGGMQLLALGIIGEYVGRTYLEVKQRPLYLIEASVGAAAPPSDAMP